MNIESAKKYYQEQFNLLTKDKVSYQSWGDVAILEGSIRVGQKILRAKSNPAGLTFQEIDINHKQSLHAGIYQKRKNINAIFITHQTNASKVTSTIPPILDDQAQLLGPNLKYLKLVEDTSQYKKQIIKGLKGRYATILSNQQSVCIGKSMEDAYVAAQLVEKTSKAFLEAKHIGGAKSINIIEAWLMHKFYLLKYSKESEKNR